MLKSDFNYQLPQDLIAQHPLENRTASRMLALDGQSGKVRNLYFTDLIDLLHPGDLLVFNNTRVIPARLFGKKPSGGRVEILVERILDHRRVLAHTRANKTLRAGTMIELPDGGRCELRERQADLWVLEISGGGTIEDILEREGHMPLPPYIRRPDGEADRQRYQTVYAEKPGAVAAPTAGLHFDEATIRRIRDKGIETAFVTLHVGSGTFQPLRVENLNDHRMHAEICEVDSSVVSAVTNTKARRGNVVAVGTTSLRALESASINGRIEIFRGETDLFITPGFQFHCVDRLLTNFHLPESTLLALVCAFAGYDTVMAAYRHAVREEYRFFSYGDAMFLSRPDLSTE